MKQKISKVLYSIFYIKLAILCLVSLLRIARAIHFQESSDLYTFQKEKVKFFKIPVICENLFQRGKLTKGPTLQILIWCTFVVFTESFCRYSIFTAAEGAV